MSSHTTCLGQGKKTSPLMICWNHCLDHKRGNRWQECGTIFGLRNPLAFLQQRSKKAPSEQCLRTPTQWSMDAVAEGGLAGALRGTGRPPCRCGPCSSPALWWLSLQRSSLILSQQQQASLKSWLAAATIGEVFSALINFWEQVRGVE